MSTENSGDNLKKKTSHKRLIAAFVLISIFIIAALVFIWFTQEDNSDPASEAIIRKEAALQLKKDPNDLTDEDFTRITYLSFGPNPTNYPVIFEFSDIKLLEKFTNLKGLLFDGIVFPKDKIPNWMKILAKFGVYDLKARFVIDLSPLEKLSNLLGLYIYRAPIKSIKPLGSLSNLRTLCLSGTGVTDLEPIKNLKNLLRLEIEQTKITNLEPLKGLTNLNILNLRETKATDLEPLKDLINLKQLSLDNTQVSDLKPFKGLINLQELDLRNCKNITNEQIEDLQKALPRLKINRQ